LESETNPHEWNAVANARERRAQPRSSNALINAAKMPAPVKITIERSRLHSGELALCDFAQPLQRAFHRRNISGCRSPIRYVHSSLSCWEGHSASVGRGKTAKLSARAKSLTLRRSGDVTSVRIRRAMYFCARGLLAAWKNLRSIRFGNHRPALAFYFSATDQ